jgi:hypothetical protein
MRRINKNYWFVGPNEIKISLMRFYVEVEITKNDETIFYRLKVYVDGKVALIFYFASLEEAVRFTEEEIDKCYTTEDIIEIYKEDYPNCDFINALGNSKKLSMEEKRNY